jgi:hypothetical protein
LRFAQAAWTRLDGPLTGVALPPIWEDGSARRVLRSGTPLPASLRPWISVLLSLVIRRCGWLGRLHIAVPRGSAGRRPGFGSRLRTQGLLDLDFAYLAKMRGHSGHSDGCRKPHHAQTKVALLRRHIFAAKLKIQRRRGLRGRIFPSVSSQCVNLLACPLFTPGPNKSCADA